MFANVSPTFHDFFGDDLALNNTGSIVTGLFLHFIDEFANASQLEVLLRGRLHYSADFDTLKEDILGLRDGGKPIFIHFLFLLSVQTFYLV